ncbi:antirestriction protein ArdA [Paraclostridium sordellii]|uniref:antirestriction protein ArdA n=1 Tax=Paraclostridium sordellii TaxID=1505 RepID=UPI0009BD9C55
MYISDLEAYNSGYLKGEWIELPTENEGIQEAILRQSKNWQSDFAIHDYKLPFEIVDRYLLEDLKSMDQIKSYKRTHSWEAIYKILVNLQKSMHLQPVKLLLYR